MGASSSSKLASSSTGSSGSSEEKLSWRLLLAVVTLGVDISGSGVQKCCGERDRSLVICSSTGRNVLTARRLKKLKKVDESGRWFRCVCFDLIPDAFGLCSAR